MIGSTFNSNKFWENRYSKGGNSGSGSYGALADFKADVINKFVEDNDVKSVIEFGCGDGEQLKKYNTFGCYLGLDVSDSAIEMCRNKFSGRNKFYNFINYSKFNNNRRADLTMSIDVLFHITDKLDYTEYLLNLFYCSNKFVIIYAYDHDVTPDDKFQVHYHPRKFTGKIKNELIDWKLIQYIPNKYSVFKFGGAKGSYSDFYIYEKTAK